LQSVNNETADYANKRWGDIFVLILRTSVKKRIPVETMTDDNGEEMKLSGTIPP
jgi:hypothetical protein